MPNGLKQTEKFAPGQSLPLAVVLDELPWNSDGLLPAVSQQYDTGEVLMMAWMNQTGPACHTGRRNCFYNLVQGDKVVVDSAPIIDPAELYGR